MLQGKTVILGVSGGIAAYKIASLASMLKKLQADVQVIMTPNATNFINPITFESLTGNRCFVDTFDRNFQFQVEHISLAKRADLFMIAPASADVVAKIAHGLADDMLTTTFLASRCPKLIAPSMNTGMLENQITVDNLMRCRSYGMTVIEPADGYLACGDIGAGKLPDPEILCEYIRQELEYEKDLSGKNILVTAGPTREALDPVRFITNHSSGKMGYAIASAAAKRGANVTLISGAVELSPPLFVKWIPVISAGDMFEAVTAVSAGQDVIIKSAAVADYKPVHVGTEKTKKANGSLHVELERTTDILAWLGTHRREGQFLCGFSMETEHMLENSRRKLKEKNVDLIVANNLRTEGAGFRGDTNVVTLISKDTEIHLELMSKEAVAHHLLTAIRESMDKP